MPLLLPKWPHLDRVYNKSFLHFKQSWIPTFFKVALYYLISFKDCTKSFCKLNYLVKKFTNTSYRPDRFFFFFFFFLIGLFCLKSWPTCDFFPLEISSWPLLFLKPFRMFILNVRNVTFIIFKGVLHLLPKISMFCALSQNNQQLFEKWIMHLIKNCSRNSKLALKF